MVKDLGMSFHNAQIVQSVQSNPGNPQKSVDMLLNGELAHIQPHASQAPTQELRQPQNLSQSLG